MKGEERERNGGDGRVCELNNVVIKRGEGVFGIKFKTHPRVKMPKGGEKRMTKIKFLAQNWVGQDIVQIHKGYKLYFPYKGKEFVCDTYDYCLFPAEEIPQELEELVGKNLHKFVEFDEYEAEKASFIYKGYEIFVEIANEQCI